MATARELQAGYIAELRSIAPAIDGWWEELNNGPRARFAQYRWPTGPAGHPRVLAVFRKYFLLIEEANDEVRRKPSAPPPENAEELWGRDSMGESQAIENPADLLIHDIATLAADVKHLALGIVFVPVGMDDYERFT
ncbi:MAG: hypothetical protein AB7I79_01135 [Rhizobiaceae bacterium]